MNTLRSPRSLVLYSVSPWRMRCICLALWVVLLVSGKDCRGRLTP